MPWGSAACTSSRGMAFGAAVLGSLYGVNAGLPFWCGSGILLVRRARLRRCGSRAAAASSSHVAQPAAFPVLEREQGVRRGGRCRAAVARSRCVGHRGVDASLGRRACRARRCRRRRSTCRGRARSGRSGVFRDALDARARAPRSAATPTAAGWRACSPPSSRSRRLVLLSYPLHRPGHPDELRTAHWSRIACPVLFLSGDRDPFAKIDLLRREVVRCATRELVVYPGLGHGLLAVREDAAARIAAFLA